MKTQKRYFAWALGLLTATAFALHGQEEERRPSEEARPFEEVRPAEEAQKPTEEEVNEIIERWDEHAREAAETFMERHGEPDEATPRRLVWHDGEWWVRTEIVNEEVPHNFPEEHEDFLYQTVEYNVPIESVADLVELSGSLIVDRVKGELTARSDSERHTLLLLNVADQVVTGLHTADSGRDVIAQAWLEGQHADMTERLLFSPEVAHPEPGDPGVVYGARPEEEEKERDEKQDRN